MITRALEKAQTVARQKDIAKALKSYSDAYAAAQKHERITEAVEILGAKLKELKLGGAA